MFTICQMRDHAGCVICRIQDQPGRAICRMRDQPDARSAGYTYALQRKIKEELTDPEAFEAFKLCFI
jgi:hypothetical protein